MRRQFPRIYRFITDPFGKFRAGKKLRKAFKLQSLVFIFLLLIILILLTTLDIALNLQKDKEQSFQRSVLTSELKTWESISQKFPNFKEAYYNMAVLSYKLGDFEKAKEYIKKALFLDPNFEKAKELLKKLY